MQLRVTNFLTHEKARPLDLDLGPGGRLAILGPAGTGKTRLLEAIAQAAPDKTPVAVPLKEISGRVTPYSLAKPFGSQIAAESLSVLGLWEQRKTPARSLAPSQLRALALLPVVAVDQGVICADGALDGLDPWRLPAVLECLLAKKSAALAIVTARPDVAEAVGRLAVLGPKGLRFFGTVEELLERAGPAECQIEAANSAAVEAVTAPLGLRVKQEKGRLTLKLDDGMGTAAKLLTNGYGVIKAVVMRQRSVAEVLAELP